MSPQHHPSGHQRPDSDECIIDTRSLLVVLSDLDSNGTQRTRNFCGDVVTITATGIDTGATSLGNVAGKTVYVCGDIAMASYDSSKFARELDTAERVYIVKDISRCFEDTCSWPFVDSGRLPILIHGVGVLYPRYFTFAQDSPNYFERISNEHTFQSMTESNKPSQAHRTGIYLTPVEPDSKSEDALKFRLLRCSTNLSGPTLNFGAVDTHIVDGLNQEAGCIFQNAAPLNHVLAQIYHNTPATNEAKQTKASISAHADKTKDMPRSGVMAFCTFYDKLDKLHTVPSSEDPFDYVYGNKGVSGLTKLRFRLKKVVAERPDCKLTNTFTVTLYPNSVFFMPLSTNRLYTHEIRPSALNAELLPTRMGYVVRCSNTEAVFRDGHTNIKTGNGDLVKLQPATPGGMAELRSMYAQENRSDDFVNYADKFMFSMNNGDYTTPAYNPIDEFRKYNVDMPDISPNLFNDLSASVHFEDVGKGRRGAVLVKSDTTRGTPIVRTTSKYDSAAFCFASVHVNLAERIRQCAALPHKFNNALIEVYDNTYHKMGFHSDQAQDLQENTCIAIYSCYRDPEIARAFPRQLVVESKSNGGSFEIELAHNSVVVLSLDTNRRFRHKIVLDTSAQPPENEWLGVTLRTSKTFVRFPENEPGCFEDGAELTLADAGQTKEFYQLRSSENKQTEFVYPVLTYSLSESDMVRPQKSRSRDERD